MASNVPPLPPPPPPPAGLPAPKKVSPVVWILGGCAVLVVLAVAAMMIGGLFIAHKVQQAGLDPDLLQKHPELAVVKMMVAANPDAELVSIDESRGIVTVRDKKTGKTVTMNFEDIKRGKMSFESEGKKVEMEGHGEGDTGSFTVKTDEGTAKFGAGAVKMPAWLPAYGGVSVQGFVSFPSSEARIISSRSSTVKGLKVQGATGLLWRSSYCALPTATTISPMSAARSMCSSTSRWPRWNTWNRPT